MAVTTERCGGCQDIGSHRRHCRKNPNYNRYLELADRAENLGDEIGANDPGLANIAYRLSGLLKAKVEGVVAGD